MTWEEEERINDAGDKRALVHERAIGTRLSAASCVACVYAHRPRNAVHCRRHPLIPAFPVVVAPDYWCGEFVRRAGGD